MKLPTPEETALSVNQVCTALGLVDIADDGTVTYRRKIVDAAINSGRLKAYCVSRGRRKRKFIVLQEDLRRFLKSCEYEVDGQSTTARKSFNDRVNDKELKIKSPLK